MDQSVYIGSKLELKNFTQENNTFFPFSSCFGMIKTTTQIWLQKNRMCENIYKKSSASI